MSAIPGSTGLAAFCLASLLLLCPTTTTAAAAVHLDAPEDIRTLCTPYLPDGNFVDPLAGEQARRNLLRDWPELLATEGYFQAEIEAVLNGNDLDIRIRPGKRTLVAGVDIDISDFAEPERRKALLAAWPLAVGEPFRQAEWNKAKELLLSELLSSDHAGARLIESRAEIDAQGGGAYLRVRYAAGPRYRIGEIRISGLERYSPDLIARYNRHVKPGDDYREERLLALQAALQSTPYFASVRVDIDREAGEATDGVVTVPLLVQLREREPQLLSFGVGYSSNTGARTELNYRNNDLLHRAWELDSGIRLEQKKQSAYADIFLPPEDAQSRYSFGALIENTDIEGLLTERASLGVQRIRKSGQLENRLSLTWIGERQIPNDAPASLARSLVANSQWIWRQVDNLLDPRRGYVLQAQIGGAAKGVMSDQSFARFYGRLQFYLPFSPQDILSLRGEAGYTAAPSRQGIPQDYLFRAGGTGSVRGYSYQSLGIKEGSATVGGRYLATASAEFTHWLDGQWGIAGFIDAGDAVDSLEKVKAALGYGFGVRWKSPAGPIAVDLAYGERTREAQLHFSLLIPF